MKDSFSEKLVRSEDGNECSRRLDPKYTAILVIDMVNDFLKPGGTMVLQEGGDILYEPINDLTQMARSNGIPIFWINQHMRPDDKLFEKRVRHCLIGSWGSKIVDDLILDTNQDVIIPKRRYSGFFQTDLDLYLRERRIKHLIVTGIVTNICVRSTVNDAFFLGYDVYVPKDCVMATSDELQEAHLYDIDTHYGTVIQSQSEVLSMLQQQSSPNTKIIDEETKVSTEPTAEDVTSDDGNGIIVPRNNIESRKKKRIGIICGSGPDAGMDMFSKLLRIHRENLGPEHYKSDKDAPNIMMLQVSQIGGPRTKDDLVQGTKDCQQTWNDLKGAIIELAPLVDCFCICCHQLHFFENQIRNLLEDEMNELPDKFVSFVQVTSKYLVDANTRLTAEKEDEGDNGNNKIAILGGPITTELFVGDHPRSPYKQLTEVMPPNSILQLTNEQRDELLEIIRAVKEKGCREETKHQFQIMLDDLRTNFDVGVVILACTEFPLLVDKMDDSRRSGITDDKERKSTLELIDPTELVAMEMLQQTQQ